MFDIDPFEECANHLFVHDVELLVRHHVSQHLEQPILHDGVVRFGDHLLPVLRDQDEGRQKDRLKAHRHRQEVEREVIVTEALRRDPDRKDHRVNVDELHIAAKCGDQIR